MKKQILVFASAVLCFAVLFTVSGAFPGKKTVATARNSTFAASETEKKSSALGGVAEVVSGINSVGDGGIINGIIGDIIGDEQVSAGISGFVGGVSEDLSGFVSGLGNRNNGSASGSGYATTSGYYEIETLTPVITEEKTTLQSDGVTPSTETETAVSTTYGLTVAEDANEVPYEKAVAPIFFGEESDGVRWMQWIFIYADYGLRSDGITGVLDDDTVSCIKRLQQERGLKVDGEVTEETINEIENLYLEKKLRENTVQTPDSSVVTEEVTETQNTGKSTLNTVIIVVIATGVWTLILGAVFAVVLIRKKKDRNNGEKSGKNSDGTAGKKNEKEAKSGEKSDGGVESLSDLFQEAEEKSKKKK